MTTIGLSPFNAYPHNAELPQDEQPARGGESEQESATPNLISESLGIQGTTNTNDGFSSTVDFLAALNSAGKLIAPTFELALNNPGLTTLATEAATEAGEVGATTVAGTEIGAEVFGAAAGIDMAGAGLVVVADVNQMVYQPLDYDVSTTMSNIQTSTATPPAFIALPPGDVISQTDAAGNAQAMDVSYVPAVGDLSSQLNGQPIGSAIYDPRSGQSYVMGENGIVTTPGNVVIPDAENPAAALGIAGGPEGSLIGQPSGTHLPQTQTEVNVSDSGAPTIPTVATPPAAPTEPLVYSGDAVGGGGGGGGDGGGGGGVDMEYDGIDGAEHYAAE